MMGTEGARGRSRFGFAGRLAVLVAAAALVPAAAVAGGGGRAQAGPHTGGPAARDGLAAAGVISTVAGGVSGPARATRVALSPCGVSFAAGFVYAGAGLEVRKVSLQTDRLTTPAGVGSVGPLGDAGPAARAGVDGACGVAVGHSGNLVIADRLDQRVRVVAARTGRFYRRAMTAGDIYTVAGTGTRGFSGDGGPATKAELSFPVGVAVDGSGNLVIADANNSRIRVVAG